MTPAYGPLGTPLDRAGGPAWALRRRLWPGRRAHRAPVGWRDGWRRPPHRPPVGASPVGPSIPVVLTGRYGHADEPVSSEAAPPG